MTLLDLGVQKMNERFTHKVANADLVLRLYTNNHTPAQSDTHSSYTICTLSGYADATLTGASWTGSLSSDVWTASYPAVTFTFSAYAGGTTIYGAVIEDGSNNTYLAGLLDTPFAVPAGGGSLVLTPSYATKQCP
jgi:hypothetical protein